MENCSEKDCIYLCISGSNYCAKHQKKARVVKATKELKVTQTIRTFVPPKKEGKATYVSKNSSLAIPGVEECSLCGFSACQGYCPASQ